ncbi:MAG: hypothetical protein K8F62_03355 [Pseudorhodoplanes sp.]|nr:hypothetical protein [Pseudorhodoplanes sp.]
MIRLIATLSLAAAIVALAAAQPALAAKKKKVAAKPACTAGALCTGPCNSAKWCNVQVCTASGKMTPTLGFCFEGSPFCPPKC